MKKVIKSTNQIKTLFLWVDSDGLPYRSKINEILEIDVLQEFSPHAFYQAR